MIREDTFAGADGRELFYRCSSVDDPRAVIIVIHGFGEHSGRYLEAMDRFAGARFACYVMDVRGFGRSAEVLGHMEDLELVRRDIRIFTQTVRETYSGIPVVLLGHSMGGLLALRQVLYHRDDYDLAITSGPALLPPENTSKLLIWLSRFLATVTPLLPVSGLEEDTETRNEELRERDKHDELNWDGGFRAKTGYELLKAQMEVVRRLGEIDLPLLALHGGDDLIMSPRATDVLVESVSSGDTTKIVFPGLYHEVLNEPERDEVFARIFAWLEDRIE
jgi:alpha-beta hydrolase superfamily lysophospholipase